MLDDDFKPYREVPPGKRHNHAYDWDARLQFIRDLRKSEGVWYCIQEYTSNAARQAKHRLSQLYPDFEFRGHVKKDGSGSKLYARLKVKG